MNTETRSESRSLFHKTSGKKPANEIKIGNDTIFRFDVDSGWEISRLNYFGHTDELTIVVSRRKPGDIRRENYVDV